MRLAFRRIFRGDDRREAFRHEISDAKIDQRPFQPLVGDEADLPAARDQAQDHLTDAREDLYQPRALGIEAAIGRMKLLDAAGRHTLEKLGRSHGEQLFHRQAGRGKIAVEMRAENTAIAFDHGRACVDQRAVEVEENVFS